MHNLTSLAYIFLKDWVMGERENVERGHGGMVRGREVENRRKGNGS